MVPSNKLFVTKPSVSGEHPSNADGRKLGIGIVLSNIVAFAVSPEHPAAIG